MRAMPQWKHWFDERPALGGLELRAHVLALPNPDAEPATRRYPSASKPS